MAATSFITAMDRLREEMEGCQLVAFADLSARMVLRVSAARKPPQERIDRLAELAAAVLDSAALQAVFAGDSPYSAQAIGEDGYTVVVRSLAEPTEALIALFPEPVGLDRIWGPAQAALELVEHRDAT